MSLKVGLLGVRGKIGAWTLKALLDPRFAPNFSSIVALGSQEPANVSELQSQAEAANVELRFATVSYDDVDGLTASLNGVDFLVSALNLPAAEQPTTDNRRQNILTAIERAGVKVYVPSEMGADYREANFRLGMWHGKLQHQLAARKIPGLKVVAIYLGYLLHIAAAPPLGYDLANRKFKIIGDINQKSSRLSMKDTGLVVAALASEFAKEGASALPDHLRVSGTSIALKELVQIFEKTDTQQRKIEIEQVSVKDFENSVIHDQEKLKGGPLPYILLLSARDECNMAQLPKDSKFIGKEGELLGPEQKTTLGDYLFSKYKIEAQTVQDLAQGRVQ